MLKTFKEFSSEISQKTDLLVKLIEMAWNRYEPETMDFFNNLSKKDPDIRSILEQINNSENQEEFDVVAKNVSDSNFGNEDL